MAIILNGMPGNYAYANNRSALMISESSNLKQWHTLEETRRYKDLKRADGSLDTYRVKLLRRDDGTTFERVGLGRPNEFIERFVFKGNFGQFEIIATRWDMIKSVPTDKYKVFLFDSMNKSELNFALTHVDEIKSALMQFPVTSPFLEMGSPKDVEIYTGNNVASDSSTNENFHA